MSGPAAAPNGTLVDIGIPTYGQPQYLGEAIECVLEQTLSSWKLTISENGPRSEHVAAIVEPHLADPRIHYVTTGKNLGGAHNSTRLIQAGSAPYVALLHDDDRWDPEFLARRVAFLEANPACGLVFSPCDFIDGAGNVLYRYEVDVPEGVQAREAFLRTLYGRCLICMPTVLVPRWAYEAVGPYFKEPVKFYDHEMWLRIAARFPVGVVPTSDAQYRVHKAQTTQQGEVRSHVGERKLEVIEAVEDVLPPGFPKIDRRRARFVALTRAGLEAFGRGQRRLGVTWLARAIRAHPAAPVDPEIVARVYQRLRQRAQDREFWSVGLTE